MINGRRYTVDHRDRDVVVDAPNMCSRCRCNNGSFEMCEPVGCPYVADSGTQTCTVDETVYQHRDTFEDDCNSCRCLNGGVRCTTRDCSDDEEDDDDVDDDDDDDDDNDERSSSCRRMRREPVCASNLRTYPNLCAALAAGFERLDVVPGACSRDVCFHSLVIFLL